MQNRSQISHLVNGISLRASFLGRPVRQPLAPVEMILGGWAGSARCQRRSPSDLDAATEPMILTEVGSQPCPSAASGSGVEELAVPVPPWAS